MEHDSATALESIEFLTSRKEASRVLPIKMELETHTHTHTHTQTHTHTHTHTHTPLHSTFFWNGIRSRLTALFQLIYGLVG